MIFSLTQALYCYLSYWAISVKLFLFTYILGKAIPQLVSDMLSLRVLSSN